MHSRRTSKTDTTDDVQQSRSLDDAASKGKRARNHSFLSVWNGWLLILCVILITAIVAFFNFVQDAYNKTISKGGENRRTNSVTTSVPVGNSGLLQIPECESSPWKPDEDLVGTCPGRKAHDTFIQTAIDCAKACCADPKCMVWQFRADKGCVQGGDVRIGLEKDGPAAYCSDHPPLRWQGQLIKERKNTECSVNTWHPDEQPGQCFGLGDVQPGIETAQGCMEACCSLERCGAWQFQETLGCFYNARMHSCQKSDDPIYFAPFVGRRKLQSSRTYTGPKGIRAVRWKQKSHAAS